MEDAVGSGEYGIAVGALYVLSDDLDLLAQAMDHQHSDDATTLLRDEVLEGAAMRFAIRARGSGP